MPKRTPDVAVRRQAIEKAAVLRHYEPRRFAPAPPPRVFLADIAATLRCLYIRCRQALPLHAGTIIVEPGLPLIFIEAFSRRDDIVAATLPMLLMLARGLSRHRFCRQPSMPPPS